LNDHLPHWNHRKNVHAHRHIGPGELEEAIIQHAPGPAHGLVGRLGDDRHPSGEAVAMPGQHSATPATTAACASWPQAWLRFSRVEANWRPVSSGIGRASISARKRSVRPGRAPSRNASTPVPPIPSWTVRPRARMRAARLAAVLTSAKASSGYRWSCRRSTITLGASSATSSASSRCVASISKPAGQGRTQRGSLRAMRAKRACMASALTYRH
jgi:hypothetical protein